MRSAVKTCRLARVDNAFRITSIDLNKVVTTIFPGRFLRAAGLGRARIIHPAVELVGLMHMAQRQVIDTVTKWLKLGHGRQSLNVRNNAVQACMHHEQTILDTSGIFLCPGSLQGLSQPFHAAQGRRSLPWQTINTQPTTEQINMGSEHRLPFPGRKQRRAFTHFRGKQHQILLVAQKLKPGNAISIIAAIVIALDCYDRDTFILELLQALDGMNERESIDGAFIKEVSSYDHEIDRSICRLVHDIPECATKIVKTFALTILLITKMYIRDMDKRSFHNSPRTV